MTVPGYLRGSNDFTEYLLQPVYDLERQDMIGLTLQNKGIQSRLDLLKTLPETARVIFNNVSMDPDMGAVDNEFMATLGSVVNSKLDDFIKMLSSCCGRILPRNSANNRTKLVDGLAAFKEVLERSDLISDDVFDSWRSREFQNMYKTLSEAVQRNFPDKGNYLNN